MGQRRVGHETGLHGRLSVRTVTVQRQQELEAPHEMRSDRTGQEPALTMGTRGPCERPPGRRHRSPPWMSFEEPLEVPPPKSPLSTSATESPILEASAASPAPTVPAPMTSRSKCRVRRCSATRARTDPESTSGCAPTVRAAISWDREKVGEVRLCVVIEGQEGVTWDEWLALARACEEHGLEGLFSSDHYVSTVGGVGVEGRDALDAWTVLAGLAASTPRLRLGTLVSPATFRHPSVLAKAVTTIDHISAGRIELGIGAGWHEVEHRAYGIPFHDSATRTRLFEEQLEILVGQWSGLPFEFRGEHYMLENHTTLPRPVQRPRPPIIVGGAARPGTVEPAVRFADEYNTYFASPETCRARASRIRAACENSGRDPATLRFSLMTGFAIGADSKDLVLRARGIMKQEAASGDEAAYLSEQADTWIVGTVEEAVHRVNELAQAGVERLFLEHLDYGNLDTIALIGSEIQPRVADM